MDLQDAARARLKEVYQNLSIMSARPALWFLNAFPTNVRTASRKNGDKYWFDVTPELYEKRQVEFFIYVCGDPNTMYVFPRLNLEHFVRHASLGGQKQVPNFTIYTDRDELEPAGHANSSFNISGFRDAFFLIPGNLE
ncbi:hypothetical protein [Marinobacter sp. LN3S78]|uniref:hypothetical protein n=1 Tax=Marinobacter sp. LN3S78 TaxID=3382300 RepID=UPI00387A9ABE